MKRQLAIEPDGMTREFIERHFSDPATGAERIVRSFPRLFEKSLDEVRGRFTREELYLMIDVLSGRYDKCSDAGNRLFRECMNEITADDLDRKWTVDRERLLDKISELTVFQSFCVELWAAAYWRGEGGTERTDIDLERHVERLIDPEEEKPALF